MGGGMKLFKDGSSLMIRANHVMGVPLLMEISYLSGKKKDHSVTGQPKPVSFLPLIKP